MRELWFCSRSCLVLRVPIIRQLSLARRNHGIAKTTMTSSLSVAVRVLARWPLSALGKTHSASGAR